MVWSVLTPDIEPAIAEILKTKSDRVLAVVGGAMIEETLLRALDYRMRPPPKAGKPSFAMEKLFDTSRPLSGFGPKADLGYALQLYDLDVWATLDAFRIIRNVFAHDLPVTSFATSNKKLRKAFPKLTLHTKHKHYPSPFWDGPSQYRIPKPKTNRAIFLANMKIVLALLMRDLRTHLAYSNQWTPLPKAPLRLPAAHRRAY